MATNILPILLEYVFWTLVGFLLILGIFGGYTVLFLSLVSNRVQVFLGSMSAVVLIAVLATVCTADTPYVWAIYTEPVMMSIIGWCILQISFEMSDEPDAGDLEKEPLATKEPKKTTLLVAERISRLPTAMVAFVLTLIASWSWWDLLSEAYDFSYIPESTEPRLAWAEIIWTYVGDFFNYAMDAGMAIALSSWYANRVSRRHAHSVAGYGFIASAILLTVAHLLT